jgi:16S rRNA (guanine527-N7)-methyltransferase
MNDLQSAPALPEMRDLWQDTLGWQPTPRQQQDFQAFYAAVLAGNQQQNLTRITDPVEFWEKHLWDSLRGVSPRLQRSGERAIDIGTGAGFPGVPIAIAYSKWNVTLLDSTQKKINFLTQTLSAMGIFNARPISDRVEPIGQHPSHRETYDLALIRAVASAPVCAEYALPLLKVGGTAILYRGQWTPEEDQALKAALKKLGGWIDQYDKFETPLSHSIRHCLHIRKTEPTAAEFPRAIGIPTQKPL